MVETSKQVRVDNWGIYFLQRLQLFFSKTDYCDLTLQFEGNVQLKVHRLVMNACTEYFAFLEQTCPALEENTIMMPTDLQADVIVPIVNFMYTGMLEFHPSIYDKLYRAAEIMNIAVLTKLLEAQLAPFKLNRGKKEKDTLSWKEAKKAPKASQSLANELPAPLPGKKVSVWKKRTPLNAALQSHPSSATFTSNKWNSDPIEKDPLSISDNTPKPTRFEWPDEDLAPISGMYPTFDDVSLTSKPLWTKNEEPKAAPAEEPPKVLEYPASRNSDSTSQDFDDEFAESEQKVNVSQLKEPVPNENTGKRKTENKNTSSPKRVKISNQDDETIISITTSNPNDVDHTKIVSEILKKYPDLVKKKRNIKLRITQSKSDQAPTKVQTIREKVKPTKAPSPVVEKPQPSAAKEVIKEARVVKTSTPPNDIAGRRRTRKADFKAASEEGPWTCMDCFGQDRDGAEFVLYYLFRKHMADQHQVEFDSTLCKYCGKKCPKSNYMVYHLYTKHGLKPPRDVVFPKCNACPFIAVTTERLEEHKKTHGKDEVQCLSCHLGFLTKKDLQGHQQIAGHTNRASSILDCAYCMKKHQSPVTLFTHVRAQHMKEARRDGVTSLDEIIDIHNEDMEDGVEEKEELAVVPHSEKIAEIVKSRIEDKQIPKDKVKIISNVKVARSEDSFLETSSNKTADLDTLREPKPETVAVTTTAAALNNIGGSLATNLGLVDIVVLDDNQQYILQQPQGQPGNAEFLLPPELAASEGLLQAAAASGELNSTDELVMVLTDHDYQDEQNQGQSDNSNIVVLYSHPVEGQQGQFITSQGNILVNSEGMLEIRNGAAITTTAGQILVNNDNTTTTQATESPIESIDLIRKEIERSDDIVQERESIKTVLRQKGKEIDKIENEVISPPIELNDHETESSSIVDSYEEEKKDLDSTLDTTDSSIQEEPMEVDEIGPPPKADLEENAEQEENEVLPPTVETEQPEVQTEQPESIDELKNDIGTEDGQGQDVPPDLIRLSQDSIPTEETPSPRVDPQLVINDPNNFQDKTNTEPLQDEDRMEVDAGKANESGENLPEFDEIDSQTPVAPEIPSNIENIIDAPLENCSQEGIHQELHEQEVLEESNNEEDLIIHSADDPNQSSESNQHQNTAKSQENPSLENNKDYISENTESHNQEESKQNDENEVNDSNDNIQPSYDDFTDESQQSSEQKTQKDLNKEILEDWDDTDSQQSQAPGPDSQDSHEPEQDHAGIIAAENVNKLMDDWDEEDEDQTKE